MAHTDQYAAMVAAAPTAASYQNKKQRDHIYETPDMYVGSDERTEMEVMCFYPSVSAEKRSLRRTKVVFVPAIGQLALEAITNATDNVGRSLRAGVDPVRIEVTTTDKIITVKNYGLPIPIEMHPTTGMMVPQLIFGELLAGSNYNVAERKDAGRNGLGVKLANIFSRYFIVTIGDPIREKHYQQTWRNGMLIVESAIITHYPRHLPPFVEVSFELDFARFGYDPIRGYPPEVQPIFGGYCASFSFAANIPFIWNGVSMHFGNIKDYARAIYGSVVDHASIVHYEWPAGAKVTKHRNGLETCDTPGVMPLTRLVMLDTPHAGEILSYVNSLVTPEGGAHVNEAVKALTAKVISTVNETAVKRRVTKKGKPEEVKASKITIADVKPHISAIIACHVINPKYDSQTKKRLMSPTPSITISDTLLRAVEKWELVSKLYAALEARDMSLMTKIDGKKGRRYLGRKGEDAHFAGTKEWRKCALMLFEGDSASGYGKVKIANIPNGSDYLGYLKLKGKPLNVMNATPSDIALNTECCDIKSMIGAIEGTDYSLEENFSRLRYPRVIIMADSDDDGKHIVGLVLLYFYCLFPSLLRRGYVTFYRTPILRVWKGTTVMKFYTMDEYRAWCTHTPDHAGWSYKYFKGLGSSDDDHVIDDLRTPRYVNCLFDPRTPEKMVLAFNKKEADTRKDWIRDYLPIPGVEEMHLQPISLFIDGELIQHSIANNTRSIPRFTDGMKEVERKVVWAMMKKWNVWRSSYEEAKVGRFAAFVADACQYHHGDMIPDVIVAMASDFVGSNNLPFFTKKGQLGSRDEGGKDASAPRYTAVAPAFWIGLMFPEEDHKGGLRKRKKGAVKGGGEAQDEEVEIEAESEMKYISPLIEEVIEEGEPRQPDWLLPILPLQLINGANGIGTAYSTYIPNHNPLDLCDAIRALAGGASELEELTPWWRDFTGTVHVRHRKEPEDMSKYTAPTVGTYRMPGEEGKIPATSATTVPAIATSATTVPAIATSATTVPAIATSATTVPATATSATTVPAISVSPDIAVPSLTPSGITVPSLIPSGIPVPSLTPSGITVPSLTHASVATSSGITVPSLTESKHPAKRNKAKISVVTRGLFYVDLSNRVIITELPIQRWTQSFLAQLNTMREEGVIKDYRPVRKPDKSIYIEITGMDTPTHHKLHLIKCFGLTNMILLDANNRPQRYDSALHILKEFYVMRLGYYEKRKQLILTSFTNEIVKLQRKLAFVTAINERKINVIGGIAKSAIFTQMDAAGFDRALLKGVTFSNISIDDIRELESKIADRIGKRKVVEETPAVDMWLADLDRFEAAYRRHYKIKAVRRFGIAVTVPALADVAIPTVGV